MSSREGLRIEVDGMDTRVHGSAYAPYLKRALHNLHALSTYLDATDRAELRRALHALLHADDPAPAWRVGDECEFQWGAEWRAGRVSSTENLIVESACGLRVRRKPNALRRPGGAR